MKNTLSYGSKWGMGLLSASLVLTILAVGAPVRAEDAPSLRVNVSESVILTADNVDKGRQSVSAKIQNPPGGLSRLSADLHNAPQKERQPVFPRSGITHRLEVFVILLSMLLEVVRQIKDRLE